MIGRDDQRGFWAVGFFWFLLTACTGQTTDSGVRWTKAGADDRAVDRQLRECTAQANAALASEHGVNADISATLGRNWSLSGRQDLQTETMRQQAGGFADQLLSNCMQAKGFTRAS